MVHFHLDRPRPWSRLLKDPSATERMHVLTADGQRLVLRRLRPENPIDSPPIVMLHGLAANHQTFHFAERSIAQWLAERGHDVWLPELRGHGGSTRREYNWLFDHYLEHDIPAILNTVLAETGADSVNWIGHSMGGVLLYCYGILVPTAPIERGIAVASALDYRIGRSGFKPLLKLRPVLDRLGAVPWGTMMHVLSPALGRGGPIEAFNVWPSNVEPWVIRRIHARVFHSIPISLLTSLSTTFEDSGFRMQNGFEFLPEADKFSIPVKLVAGSRDQQVSVKAVENTARLIGENAEVRVYGRDHGEADDYGHFDLLLGARAQQEVWPEIADWFEV